MVFESLVVDLVNRFLGDFIENLDKSQLSIGIWGGGSTLLYVKPYMNRNKPNCKHHRTCDLQIKNRSCWINTGSSKVLSREPYKRGRAAGGAL